MTSGHDGFRVSLSHGAVWAVHGLASQCPNIVFFPVHEWDRLKFPAKQFVPDLDAVLRAKNSMTRRQWISLLEAIVRLGAVAHSLWLCDVNDFIWRALKGALDGKAYPPSYLLQELANRGPYLSYGNPAVPDIREFASRYLSARLGINLVLWRLQALGVATWGSIASVSDLAALLANTSANAPRLGTNELLGNLATLQDQHSRTIACKKGIGSNLVEFARHVLGQRQTASENLRGYDQGYVLRKSGDYSSAPWWFHLAPLRF